MSFIHTSHRTDKPKTKPIQKNYYKVCPTLGSDKEADNGSDEVADSFQMPVMSFIIYMTVMLFQVDASKPIVANGEKLLFQINEYKPTIMRQFCSKRKTLHATFPD